jgi:hypothetical protein
MAKEKDLKPDKANKTSDKSVKSADKPPAVKSSKKADDVELLEGYLAAVSSQGKDTVSKGKATARAQPKNTNSKHDKPSSSSRSAEKSSGSSRLAAKTGGPNTEAAVGGQGPAEFSDTTGFDRSRSRRRRAHSDYGNSSDTDDYQCQRPAKRSRSRRPVRYDAYYEQFDDEFDYEYDDEYDWGTEYRPRRRPSSRYHGDRYYVPRRRHFDYQHDEGDDEYYMYPPDSEFDHQISPGSELEDDFPPPTTLSSQISVAPTTVPGVVAGPDAATVAAPDTDTVAPSGVPADDLLTGYAEILNVADCGSALVAEKLPGVVQEAWQNERPGGYQDLFKQHLRPSNIVDAQKTQCNEEVFRVLGHDEKSMDIRLKNIQATITTSVYPVLRNIDELCTPSFVAIDKKKQVDNGLDAMSMLAVASRSINQLRRDLIKPHLDPKFQSLCYRQAKPAEGAWLFGEDFLKNVKTKTETTFLGKKRGGGFRPAFGGRYIGRGRYHNTQRGRGRGRGQGHPAKRGFRLDWGEIFQPSTGQLHSNLHTSNLNNSHTDNILPHSRNVSFIHNADDLVLSVGSTAPGSPTRPVPQRQTWRRPPDGLDQLSDSVDSLVRCYGRQFVNQWQLMSKQTFIAGNLSNHYAMWTCLTSDRSILEAISGYKLDIAEFPSSGGYHRPIRFSDKEKLVVAQEIELLLKKGVVRLVQHEAGEFISNIFTRTKKDSAKYRVILNLSDLNQLLYYFHFKMDTLQNAVKLVTKNCFCASIDLSDAYYTVNVADDMRKFLRFEFGGDLFEFTCLPNGLSPGPRIFTKIMKVPLSYLRSEFGHIIVGYLDDLLILGDTVDEVTVAVRDTIDVLTNLGFRISADKSQIIPSRTIEFLGFLIDTAAMQVSIPAKKADKLTRLCTTYLRKDTVTIREAAQLLGNLSATLPANDYAKLFSKTLEVAKTGALRGARGEYDSVMVLPLSVKQDLRWWIANLQVVRKPIGIRLPDITFTTDASGLGWGGFVPIRNWSTGGRWHASERSRPINELELLAVLFTLQAFFLHHSNLHLRVLTDNTVTMLCITNQGSTRSGPCNRIAREIWDWCMLRHVWISACHLPGIFNVEADALSRHFQDETEWALHPKLFAKLCARFGTPEVDLFASRLNCKVDLFYSWHPDPDALKVDALAVTWDTNFGYAFPPFSIIPMVLQKMRMEPASVLLIVPTWTTQAWWSRLGRLLMDFPVVFPVGPGTLYQPHQLDRVHPLAGKLSLIACLCSNNPSNVKEFRHRLYRRCLLPGDPVLDANIVPTLNGGESIALRGTSIPLQHL